MERKYRVDGAEGSPWEHGVTHGEPLATPAPVKAADDVERVELIAKLRWVYEEHVQADNFVRLKPGIGAARDAALRVQGANDVLGELLPSILASLTPTPPTDVAGLVEAVEYADCHTADRPGKDYYERFAKALMEAPTFRAALTQAQVS